MVDEILKEMSPQFAKLYFECGTSIDRTGTVVAVAVVADLLSARSERMLIEQLQYNLLFRWFVGMEMDEEGVESCGVKQESGAFAERRDRGGIFPGVHRTRRAVYVK